MMSDEEYLPLYTKYRPVIIAIAMKLCNGQPDWVDDLAQEGFIALANIDVSKITSNESSFVRQSVKFRMIDFLRREAPARYESLEAMLESEQWELEYQPHTAEPRFRPVKPGARR